MTRNELPRGHKMSMANEDYLEAIYRITLEDPEGRERGIRSVDIAEQIGVSKASVSKALTTLKELEMVEQMRYGRVMLTRKGEVYARRVWRSHRVLRAFLVGELGVDAEVADEEACLLEHYLSEDTMNRWCDYLERNGVEIGD